MVRKYSTDKVWCEACELYVGKPDYSEHLVTKDHKQKAVFIENT